MEVKWRTFAPYVADTPLQRADKVPFPADYGVDVVWVGSRFSSPLSVQAAFMLIHSMLPGIH